MHDSGSNFPIFFMGMFIFFVYWFSVPVNYGVVGESFPVVGWTLDLQTACQLRRVSASIWHTLIYIYITYNLYNSHEIYIIVW